MVREVRLEKNESEMGHGECFTCVHMYGGAIINQVVIRCNF